MKVDENSIRDLKQIPGVGKSIALDFLKIGIKSVKDLKGKNPETLYGLINKKTGFVQDRYLHYVFRCAVYYASTERSSQHPERLKWWNWTDSRMSDKTRGI